VLDGESFDLVINLEDDIESARFLKSVTTDRLFGAYTNNAAAMAYTQSAHQWFDLSLISVHGKKMADELKLHNRRTYQELIFEGLGFQFAGEDYLLPPTCQFRLKIPQSSG
jgi:hypothetical protein